VKIARAREYGRKFWQYINDLIFYSNRSDNPNMCIICTKDMKSIKSAKLHLITSTVKFHTQLKKKIIVPNPYYP